MAPRRKITEEQWNQLYAEYLAWDPEAYGSRSIYELIEPYGISKQTFYNELRRRGLALKTVQTVGPNSAAMEVMLETLLEARQRVKLLEQTLKKHGIPIP